MIQLSLSAEKMIYFLFPIPQAERNFADFFFFKATLGKSAKENNYTHRHSINKLTWLALGEDHAARSRRVEQLTAL